MIRRPSLLMMTAGAAAVAMAANGVSAASPEPAPAPQTRLGAAIQEDIAARDAAAARRKRALDMREQAAEATEARLKADLDAKQQDASRAQAEPNRNKDEEEESDQYEELARIYQAMKPARAAIIFEQLDMDVQMKVAQRMRERSTGLILASMTPKGAAALSMALARRSPGRPQPAKPSRKQS